MNLYQNITEGMDKMLHSDQPKDMKIKFHQGKPNTLELTGAKSVHLSARLSDLLQSNGYQELVIKTVKGKIVYCSIKSILKL